MDEMMPEQSAAEEGTGQVEAQLEEGGATTESVEMQPEEKVPERLSWEQVLADPEYGDEYRKSLQVIENRRRQEQSQQSMGRANAAREHLDKLKLQAAELEKAIPSFELGRELSNPDFLRLTAPHTGLSLEQAYYAVHYKELSEGMRQESLLSAVRAVRSGAERPAELKGGQSASSLVNDPKNMSREQREALKKRIYEAGVNGRKLPYGQ